MTCIHDLTVDLARASKSVNEILETIGAAYPGKGLLQTIRRSGKGSLPPTLKKTLPEPEKSGFNFIPSVLKLLVHMQKRTNKSFVMYL